MRTSHKPFKLSILAATVLLASCSRLDDFKGHGPKDHGPKPVSTDFTHRATIQVGGETAAEVSAFDPKTNKLFTVNAESGAISVYDLSDISSPIAGTPIMLTGAGTPNSVAVHEGKLAVAAEAPVKQEPGTILVYDTDSQNLIASYTVGALPDMVAFTPNGRQIVSANEGEPSDDYQTDPKGSVSIIELATGMVSTLEFDAFNGQEASLRAQGFRVFGPGADLATDTEPEYVAISDNSRIAWVSLQENNGIARVNLATKQIEAIYPLGFKDHSDLYNSMDASDKDGIKELNTWPVLGMYLPDGLAYAKINGMDLVISANEGDSRDYGGFSEEERIEDLTLDPLAFPDAATLQAGGQLGRLKTTSALGDADGDGQFEELYSYGGRSFTIWSGSGELLFDSGNDIGEQTLARTPERFNDNDSRSDDKGGEPESVAVLELKNNTFLLFVGLERNDQILVYDISNPFEPVFLDILSHPGDEAPEGLLVVEPKDSPTGNALLIVSNEDSGTVSIYEN